MALTLTRLEKVELALIPVVAAAAFALAGSVRWAPRFGALIGYSAALLLAQGLIRDVARMLLFRAPGEKRKIACLCAESTVGLLLVLVALGLTLLGIEDTIALGRAPLAGLILGLLVFGFIAKDYVIIIRKEKDHASVIVW